MAGVLRSHAPATVEIVMFSAGVRILWFAVMAGTLFSELVPLPQELEAQFPPAVFLCFEAAKLGALWLGGFLTALAWWHYKSLSTGALLAFGAAVLAEAGQGYIPGHRSSLMELAMKLVLLSAGFALGLKARTEQRFQLGPLAVFFSSRYW